MRQTDSCISDMYSIIRKGAVDEIEADIEVLRQRDNRCTD